ncbi:murein DD-endopeptidase MepM/ murein hydrolase activator NlpD [Lentzea atacamensis]|uniref:Murein DD-endopeptidase MepM/ murein hydrolase activator NlpD n=3 Tax=Lentzea TaxID=165301 RepID=A0ABX9EEP0_9PSEU|nr:M23 family metallopeptidase [Lentzea atacamensis]RAS68830.1 murein DD-endopeptidase MepM/ murein hydrolase activator NlpD [Lentzea atacamensis]
MSHHRSPGGHERSAALDEAVDRASTRTVSSHRLPPPPSALRGRIVVAAVAVGAFAAAGAGQTLQAAADDSKDVQLTNHADGAATFDGMGGDTASAPQILAVSKTTSEGSAEAAKMLRSQQMTAQREAAEAEKKRPKFFRPAAGDFTSGYGGRWGTMHLGIDIAGPIGTPILSVADGVVIESGPASGFGLWVRVQHADGTITVYGHIDSSNVREGQQVKAGQQIARMGNRGFSTGPHLHFEVWNPGGQKVNPLTWLNARGVTV